METIVMYAKALCWVVSIFVLLGITIYMAIIKAFSHIARHTAIVMHNEERK